MPRSPRLLAPWVGEPNAGPAIYHCVSRVVDRRKVFHSPEKEKFVHLMRRYERFCGVTILGYCVMSNHFHLHVEVPPRPAGGLSDEELCKRLAVIKSEAQVAEIREQLERCRKANDEKGAEAIRESYFYWMWNLSEFMKTLKQCFTRWFNRQHNRRGTLWEERFKSVLVQDGYAAAVVGAYIDLNPLRAKIVGKPEAYRWCGYAEALAGGPEARAGIMRLMQEHDRLAGGAESGRACGWSSALAAYRLILFRHAEERRSEDPATGEEEVVRWGMSREEVQKVLARGGKLSVAEMLRCRMRVMTDGVVIGADSFVNAFFEAKREMFGPKRKDGARRIRGCETELRVLRDLRKDALGA